MADLVFKLADNRNLDLIKKIRNKKGDNAPDEAVWNKIILKFSDNNKINFTTCMENLNFLDKKPIEVFNLLLENKKWTAAENFLNVFNSPSSIEEVNSSINTLVKNMAKDDLPWREFQKLFSHINKEEADSKPKKKSEDMANNTDEGSQRIQPMDPLQTQNFHDIAGNLLNNIVNKAKGRHFRYDSNDHKVKLLNWFLEWTNTVPPPDKEFQLNLLHSITAMHRRDNFFSFFDLFYKPHSLNEFSDSLKGIKLPPQPFFSKKKLLNVDTTKTDAFDALYKDWQNSKKIMP